MTMNTIKAGCDISGNSLLVMTAPRHIDQVVVTTAGTAVDYTVPDSCDIVVFSSDNDFYVKPNGAGAMPATAVVDGTAWDINPVAYMLSPFGSTAISTLRFDAAFDGTIVRIKCYNLEK